MVAVRVLSPAQREAVEGDLHAQLRSVAIQLAENTGFDHVTVDQIAERGRISRRTFFRYFASKEDVLFSDHARYLTRMEIELAHTRESPTYAVANSLHVVVDGYLADQHMVFRRRRLLANSPLLMEREALWFGEYEKTLKEHLRSHGITRAGLDCILPAALIAALRYALDTWAANPRDVKLADTLQALAFQLTQSLECGLAPDPPGVNSATEVIILRTHHSTEAIARAIQTLDTPGY